MLDTSSIIDGRILDVIKTGFISDKIIVPNFVILELQLISDSSDPLKRAKGRRGLDLVNELTKFDQVEISQVDFTDVREVDTKLLKYASSTGSKLVTNDFNLNKVAEIQGVQVLNINDLANAVKTQLVVGEHINVQIIRAGSERQQGVAYLPDGTMIVIEDTAKLIDKTVTVEVAKVLQTSAGRIIYLLVGEAFLSLLLKAFGATTDVFPYAKQYASITLIGMPFLIVTNGMSNLIRADGKPKYSMVCMVMGAIINTILDPIFIFACDWGIAGAAWATVIGQIFSFILALRYLWRFQTIHFEKESFLLDIKESMKICSMGISSSSNQIAVTVIQIIQYNSLTYYGALTKYGTDIPLAACGIVMKTNAIILAIVVGISQGTQPIIGFNYGARQYHRVREAYLLAVKWNLVVSTIAFIAFQFFPQSIISLIRSYF